MKQKTDNRCILQHIPSGFYVTGADGFTDNISRAKLYEFNASKNPTEWADKLDTGDYKIIVRSETITVRYEEMEF